MKNVIRNEKILNHNVEPYRFKVLSTIVPNTNEVEEKEEHDQEVSANSPIVPQEEIPAQEEMQEQNSSKPIVEDAFVEKLLEKTDELSSNIIKLQMQIESQEEEFSARLKDEVQRAKEDGIKEGEESAAKTYEEKITQLQSQYTRSISILNEEHLKFQEFMKKSELELSEIAIDVSKEVIQKEISKESKEVALSLAKVLMKELEDATKIEIKVNSADLSYLEESIGDKSIKISADDAIAKGGVIVLSDVGNLDGSIDIRLAKVKQMAQE